MAHSTFTHAVALVGLLLLGACSCHSALPPQEPPPPTTPSSSNWTVEVVAVQGAPSREDVLNSGAAGTPELVDADAFLEHVQAAKRAVEAFHEPMAIKERKTLHRVTDWEVSEAVMRALVRDAVAKRSPSVVRGEDVMGYPRVVLVWESVEGVRLLRLADNNDNTSLTLSVMPGELDINALGLQNMTVHAPGMDPLEIASFLTESQTVYPHIEEYRLDAPGFLKL